MKRTEGTSITPASPAEFVKKWLSLLFPYFNTEDATEFVLDLARSFPATANDLTKPCEACKHPEGAVNHVRGHVFVGMGHGWQPCPTCGGASVVPRETIE